MIPIHNPREEEEEDENESSDKPIWPKAKKGQEKKSVEKANEEKSLEKIVGSTLPDKRNGPLSETEIEERDETLKELRGEWSKLGRVHEGLSEEEWEAMAREAWADPKARGPLWEAIPC
jgi:hypothetical protein